MNSDRIPLPYGKDLPYTRYSIKKGNTVLYGTVIIIHTRTLCVKRKKLEKIGGLRGEGREGGDGGQVLYHAVKISRSPTIQIISGNQPVIRGQARPDELTGNL